MRICARALLNIFNAHSAWGPLIELFQNVELIPTEMKSLGASRNGQPTSTWNTH